MTAIRTEDTELTVRGCSFRRTNSREGATWPRSRFERCIPPAAAGDRPPAVLADSCHFDGGQTGILAEGPVDIVLRDCTMGPGQPSVWFDNARSNVPVFGELRLCTRASWRAPRRSFASTALRHVSGSTTASSRRRAGRRRRSSWSTTHET